MQNFSLTVQCILYNMFLFLECYFFNIDVSVLDVCLHLLMQVVKNKNICYYLGTSLVVQLLRHCITTTGVK